MNTVCPASSSPSGSAHSECPNCGFADWCLSANLTLHEAKQFNGRIKHRHPVKRYEYLHHAGAALTSLFVVSNGFLKTSITDGEGREQITGFPMTGDLIGMDGFGMGKHLCDTVALEDSHLCGITYSDFEQLANDIPALQRHFHRVMGAEIARDHGIMLLLGAMTAEERVAIFLLSLSKRFAARGYSGTHFRLAMTRQDIGSYLGLNLETVSRAFSHFHNVQLIAINNKNVEIRDLAQLQQIVGGYRMPRSPTRIPKSETN